MEKHTAQDQGHAGAAAHPCNLISAGILGGVFYPARASRKALVIVADGCAA